MRQFFKIFFLFSNKIKPPQNPTMAESFGTKISEKEIQNFMNPIGFLKESDYKNYEGINEKNKIIEKKNLKIDINEKNKKFNSDESVKKAENNNSIKEKSMSKEYGFKTKGPEPTRYGDWENKGRCTDF